MENASKAVIMAGSVFLAVAIISLALYAYGYFRDYARSSEELFTISQIQSFNRYYESYYEGIDTIRGVDAINIYNKAIDDGIDDTNIHIPDELKNYLSLSNPSENFLKTYNYDIDYNLQGIVSEITIAD